MQLTYTGGIKMSSGKYIEYLRAFIGGAFFITAFFWITRIFDGMFFNICLIISLILSVASTYDRDSKKMLKNIVSFLIGALILYIVYYYSPFLINYYIRITGEKVIIGGSTNRSFIMDYFGIIWDVLAYSIIFLILFSISALIFRKRRMRIKMDLHKKIILNTVSIIQIVIIICGIVNINNIDALLWFSNLFRKIDCC